MNSQKTSYLTISFYKFLNIPNTEEIQKKLKDAMSELGIVGTILLATEGINTTLCGKEKSLRSFVAFIGTCIDLSGVAFKESYSELPTFRRALVKIKKEIVTMRVNDINPKEKTGKYLSPKAWHEWLSRSEKDFILIDTRNGFEYELGAFEGAINPKLDHFTQFPEYVKSIKAQDPSATEKPVLMYCTGGIRCEKASAYMIHHEGFQEVYQLDGGILGYFQEMGKGHFNGSCFVFDRRVAVDEKLEPTPVEDPESVNAVRLIGPATSAK